MRSILTPLASLMWLVPVVPLLAQTDQSLIGARVRITIPHPTDALERPTVQRQMTHSHAKSTVITGQLVAISDSTMSVLNDANDAHVAVPLSRIRRIEVSVGPSRAASARRGGLIGVIAGGIVGFAAGEDCTTADFICFERPATAFAGAAVGAALGSVVGYLVGGVERWRDAEIPARASVVPTGGGSVLIGATLRF